jgi:hypothetical protein
MRRTKERRTERLAQWAVRSAARIDDVISPIAGTFILTPPKPAVC